MLAYIKTYMSMDFFVYCPAYAIYKHLYSNEIRVRKPICSHQSNVNSNIRQTKKIKNL